MGRRTVELYCHNCPLLQLQKTQYLQLGQNRGQYYGGSLPNVNQIGNSVADIPFQNSGLDTNRSTRHHGLVDRVYRDRNRITSPHRKPLLYCLRLSEDNYLTFNRVNQKDFVQKLDSTQNISGSKPCKVPGIHIFPSPDQQLSPTLKPAAHNTGGSLPDLTNIQFPPPLPTPLDSDDAGTASSFSSSPSTQTLSNTQGVNSSQPTVTMEMESGQDNMVPLILNTGDSHQQQNLQLSPTSPPLTLSQAAINAMNLEQQLSQYVFFNQQPSSETHQSQQQTGLVQLMSSVNSCPTLDNHMSSQTNMTMDMNTASSLQQYRSRVGSSANQSPTSPVSNQGFSPGGSPQHNSILGSVFADFYDQQLPSLQASALSQQLEQFNMMETPISSDGLYNQTSTLNYSQALMMGLTGGHCNLQDSQQLGYSSHGNIPNIILTVSGESPPSLPKDLTGSLSTDVSFDIDSQFPLDDLKIDPLTLDGLHMLNDPDMVLADPATEDAFRLDRL
ncbi:hypothetical protein F2P81_000756 [Scophthalmus maximus]|uniref:CREB-regulated transcription coactivator 1-like n=1 Tax=Scophthalmus maximus TaxID=52904 RepID=A0A6A4TLW4_SCOMX|nr:hypothetical protein F2P81_000756 [Scophthalmus maximus]